MNGYGDLKALLQRETLDNLSGQEPDRDLGRQYLQRQLQDLVRTQRGELTPLETIKGEGVNAVRTLSPNHPNSPDRGAEPTVSAKMRSPEISQLLEAIRMGQFQRLSGTANGGFAQAQKALLLGPGGNGTTLAHTLDRFQGGNGSSGGYGGSLQAPAVAEQAAQSAQAQRMSALQNKLNEALLRKQMEDAQRKDYFAAYDQQRAQDENVFRQDRMDMVRELFTKLMGR